MGRTQDTKVQVNYDRISAIAKAKGVTTHKISQATGHNNSWYSKARIDNRALQIADVATISKLLGVTPKDICVDPVLDDLSNLITDMAVNNEPTEAIEKAIECSKDVIDARKNAAEKISIDYDKLYSLINAKYPSVNMFCEIIGTRKSWLAESKADNRKLPLARVQYMCYLLECEVEDIEYIEPEPEPEPEVMVTSGRYPCGETATQLYPSIDMEWIRDAYTFLRKDSLNMMETMSECKDDIVKILVQINNNLAAIKRALE